MKPTPLRRTQAGAATLAVVMMLFFIVSLTAAYTARNLIFEQRTASNQYRATQAFEAAEAGLEWALTQLNAGRIDTTCAPTDDAAFGTFRQRYLTLTTPAVGDVRRVPRTVAQSAPLPALAASPTGFQWAACVFNGTTWVCSCPTNGDPVLAVPEGAGPFPAFAVRFADQTARQGIVRVEVNGCNSLDWECLVRIRDEIGAGTVCRSTLCSMVALHGAARVTPAAAVTARGAVTVTGTGVTVRNTDVASGALTVRAGGTLTGTPALQGAPGTPGARSVLDNDASLRDPALADDTAECAGCLFTATFGVRPSSYRLQPAVVELDCSGGCTTAQVATAAAVNPGRPLWLSGAGGVDIDDAALVLGTANVPLVLVVEGPLRVSAAATIHGVAYAGSVTMTAGTVNGAVLSTGTVDLQGSTTVAFDRAVLDRLQLAAGSFVRVPGGWRDLP
jgi:hypothetical protein